MARREHIDCIIPCCEEVMFLACHQEQLPEHCHLYAPEFSTLRFLHNKWLFVQSLHGFGVKSPHTALLENAQALESWQAENPQADCVIKPVFGRFGTGLRKAGRSKPQRMRFPVLAQERLGGEELCSYSLAYQGKLMAHTVYSPKYRAGPGAGVYFEPRAHPGIDTFVAHYIAVNRLSGQIAFDFFVGKGFVAPIECNPRATSGLHLLPPDMDMLACLNGTQPAQPPAEHSPKPCMLPFGMALYVGQHVRQHGFSTVLFDCANARHALAHCGKKPGLASQLAAFAELAARCARYRLGLREASTRDIAWNHDAAP